MTAATRSAWFFMRLPGGRIGLGVARAHRHATEAEAMQQVADAALVQLDLELSRDLLAQIDHTPADHALGLEVGTGSHPLGHRRLLPLRQLARRTAFMRLVGQAGQALGTVTMHPVAQRLPVIPHWRAAAARHAPSITSASIRREARASAVRPASRRKSAAVCSVRVIDTVIAPSPF